MRQHLSVTQFQGLTGLECSRGQRGLVLVHGWFIRAEDVGSSGQVPGRTGPGYVRTLGSKASKVLGSVSLANLYFVDHQSAEISLGSHAC